MYKISKWRTCGHQRVEVKVVSVLISAVPIVYDSKGNRTQYTFFRVPEEGNTRKLWCEQMRRIDGKDGFRVTSATTVCSMHFRQEDVLRVPGGKRNRLKKNACPVKWNKTPAPPHGKRKAPTPRSGSSHKQRRINFDEGEDMQGTVVVPYVKVLAASAAKNSFHMLNQKLSLAIEENTLLKLKAELNEKRHGPVFSMEDIKQDKDACSRYTGFPSHSVFQTVFELLCPGENGKCYTDICQGFTTRTGER